MSTRADNTLLRLPIAIHSASKKSRPDLPNLTLLQRCVVFEVIRSFILIVFPDPRLTTTYTMDHGKPRSHS